MVSQTCLDYQTLVCDKADVQFRCDDGYHVCSWYERNSYILHPIPYRTTKLLTKLIFPVIYMNHITAQTFRLRGMPFIEEICRTPKMV
jgi:hypothetical protein